MLRPFIIAACASSLLLWAVGTAADEAVLMAEQVAPRPGETLMDIARAQDLGFVELRAANPGIDPWLPQADAVLLLPSVHLAPPELARVPLVVNLSAMRLYWRSPTGEIASFPVGIGRDGMGLRPSVTRVVRKRRDPVWVPPPSVLAEKPDLPDKVPPGPDNPLGAYSLDLAEGLIRIHGTNLPDGVGRRVSHGCFRLYPEDIEHLFAEVPVGTPVAIIDAPLTVARVDGEWWLEIHPGQDDADAIEAGETPPSPPLAGVEAQIAAAVGEDSWRVDWGAVEWARTYPTGAPIRITRPEAPPPVPLAVPADNFP